MRPYYCFSNLLACLIVACFILMIRPRQSGAHAKAPTIGVLAISANVFFAVWLMLIPIIEITKFFVVGDRNSWLDDGSPFFTAAVALFIAIWIVSANHRTEIR